MSEPDDQEKNETGVIQISDPQEELINIRVGLHSVEEQKTETEEEQQEGEKSYKIGEPNQLEQEMFDMNKEPTSQDLLPLSQVDQDQQMLVQEQFVLQDNAQTEQEASQEQEELRINEEGQAHQEVALEEILHQAQHEEERREGEIQQVVERDENKNQDKDEGDQEHKLKQIEMSQSDQLQTLSIEAQTISIKPSMELNKEIERSANSYQSNLPNQPEIKNVVQAKQTELSNELEIKGSFSNRSTKFKHTSLQKERYSLQNQQQSPIAAKIEAERLNQIHEQAKNLSQKLKLKGRCEICTLPLPCQHSRLQEEQQLSIKQNDYLIEYNDYQDQGIRGEDRYPSQQLPEVHDYQSAIQPSRDFVDIDEAQELRKLKAQFVEGQNLQEDDSPTLLYPKSQQNKFPQFQNKRLYGGLGNSQRIPKKVSPYSILKSSRVDDIDEELQRCQQMGFKNTRAQVLRHLHLKKQLQENPLYQRYFEEAPRGRIDEEGNRTAYDLYGRMSRERRFNHSLDMQNEPVIRKKNRRGEYVSVEASKLQKPTKEEQIRQAEQRLRVIEKISKYREEKIKREFQKLEEEMKKDEERVMMEKEKERKRRAVMENVKKDIQVNWEEKKKKEQEEKQKEEQMQRFQYVKQKQIKQQQIAICQKQKIKEYKEMQAKQDIFGDSQYLLNKHPVEVVKERKAPLPLRYTDQFNLRTGEKWVKTTKNSQDTLAQIEHNQKISYGIYMKSNKIPERFKKIGGKTIKVQNKNQITEESNKNVNTYDSLQKESSKEHDVLDYLPQQENDIEPADFKNEFATL